MAERHPARSAEGEEEIRFRPDVRTARLDTGTLVLISRTTGRTVRVGRGVEPLLPLLFTGIRWDDLLASSQRLHGPRSRLEEQLREVVRAFGTAGLLEGSAAPSGSRRAERTLVLGSPDAVAAFLARSLLRLPGALRIALGVGASGLGLWGLRWMLSTWTGAVPAVRPLTLAVAAGAILLVVTAHEMGHAVACRLAGAPVSAWGVLLSRGVIPAPFVETSASTLVSERAHRLVVPLGGPAADLWSVGVFAAIAATASPGPLRWAASVAGTVAAVALALNLKPLRGSDGARALGFLAPSGRRRRAAFQGGYAIVYLSLCVWVGTVILR